MLGLGLRSNASVRVRVMFRVKARVNGKDND